MHHTAKKRGGLTVTGLAIAGFLTLFAGGAIAGWFGFRRAKKRGDARQKKECQLVIAVGSAFFFDAIIIIASPNPNSHATFITTLLVILLAGTVVRYLK